MAIVVQTSHSYMTTRKTTIAVTIWTFVSKVMSLLFNILSRFVRGFLPRSKHLLISWLESPSAVILEPRKIKSDTVSTVSPSLPHEVMGPDAMIFVFCIGTWNVRSMNQGKLEVVKQEMARVNNDILGISELKWTGMGEFNLDNHYIHYCGQESLTRNGVAIIVNQRV